MSVRSSFSADVYTSFVVRLFLEGLAVRKNSSIYKTTNRLDAVVIETKCERRTLRQQSTSRMPLG